MTQTPTYLPKAIFVVEISSPDTCLPENGLCALSRCLDRRVSG